MKTAGGVGDRDVKVSVLIPCRNEVTTIDDCIEGVFSFDPPEGGFEVIVVDGMSDDGTRERLERLKERYRTLLVIDNPEKFVPHGMNLGIRAARGEYIVRVDARCVHPKNYLVELLSLSAETGAANVGGVLQPMGKGYTQRAIAQAYRSRIAVGGALRNRGDFVGENDSVYGGCFRKAMLVEAGMYDETMVRNQDDELSFRIRKAGGKIIQSGSIRIGYYPRDRFLQLFKQFLQYGFWKTIVVRKHPMQASVRHFIPAIFVLVMSAMAVGGLFDRGILVMWLVVSAAYLICVAVESFRVCETSRLSLWPAIAWSIILMHAGYGTGFLAGIACNFLGMDRTWFTTLSR